MNSTHPRIDRFAFFLIILFLLMSFFLINDYGPNIDSPRNFMAGSNNLDFLLKGTVDVPALRQQMHGAFFLMLADASRRVLSDRFHLLNPIAARQILLPILTTFFAFYFFFFVRRYWDSLSAMIAVSALLTYPAFFGDTFNNMKDVPLLIFFSFSIMSFVDWNYFKNRVSWCRGFIFLGLALSIKLYALMILPILLTWKLISSQKKGPPSQGIFPWIAGIAFAAWIFSMFYAPVFWGIHGKSVFIRELMGNFKLTLHEKNPGWDFFAVKQIFYRTPVIFLLFGLTGFTVAILQWRKNAFNSLLILWMMLPIVLPSLLQIHPYNGLRHFFVFLVPFSMFASKGLNEIQTHLCRVLHAPKKITVFVLILALVVPNVWGIIKTHPYETMYFNSLAGGLKGAQEKGIRDASDFWLNSAKEAAAWLDKNAPENSNLYCVYPCVIMMKQLITRNDLNIDCILPDMATPPQSLEHIFDMRMDKIFRLDDIPMHSGKTFVMVIPHDYVRGSADFQNRLKTFKPVYKIERQGGEILTLYLT